jgi:glucose/arabinose dehydrogenase
MKSLTLLPLAVALGASPSAAFQGGLADPIPAPIEPGGPPVKLELVATGMTAPNWGTSAPGVPGFLFVTDQIGILWSVDLATGEISKFLDVSALLVPLGGEGPGSSDERGFLGMAFHPSYAANGLVYTYTSEPAIGTADFPVPLGAPADHQSVVMEWHVPDPSDPTGGVDMSSGRVLLRIGQPQANHNGGCLVFGSDDMLYVSLGDGGNADDQGPGHVAGGNGQDTGNVLGKVLRIDPLGSDSSNGQYGLPTDNPFFPGGAGPFGGSGGCLDGSCDEIFAFGMRNPFRFSFDSSTGDLLLADVGQNDIEEVDFVVPGGNYGWPVKEGSFCFDMNGSQDGFVLDPAACSGAGLIDPIAEYDHDEGVAVIGGFVYRGSEIPRLRGRYVFGELVNPTTGTGRLLVLGHEKLALGTTAEVLEMKVFGPGIQGSVLGFGEDGQGNLYVMSNLSGTPFRTDGRVQRIAPLP